MTPRGVVAASPVSEPHDFLVAVHGVLRMHPWLATVPEADLPEDAHSLVLKRAEALGLSRMSPRGPDGWRWHQSDAGGDWSQDGSPRRLVWLRAVGGMDEAEQGLPVHAAFAVLGDVLDLLGDVEIHEVRAALPLAAGPRDVMRLVGMNDWFEMSRPGSGSRLAVTVATEHGVSGEALRTEINRDRRRECLTLDHAESAPVTVHENADWAGMLAPSRGTVLRGSGRTWSLAFASWVVEVVADACVAVGAAGPAFVTVRNADHRET